MADPGSATAPGVVEREIPLTRGRTLHFTIAMNPGSETETGYEEIGAVVDTVFKATSLLTATNQRGIDMDELLDVVTAAIDSPAGDPSMLTDLERQLLGSIGVTIPDHGEAARLTASQALQNAADYASILASSLGVADFASLADVGPSRVRQRLNDERTLWGFKAGPRHGWRIPAWEITPTGVLPGIDIVGPAIPPDMHPVGVFRLVNSPNPDLEMDGEQLSVVQWLRAGHDPAVAAQAIGRPSELV